MRFSAYFSRIAFSAIVGFASIHAFAQETPIPRHLEIARELAATVTPENNSYTLHPPNGRGIFWKGDKNTTVNAVHTACVGFVAGVLYRAHAPLPHERPLNSKVYFSSAIHGDSLTHIKSINDVQPGDVFIFICNDNCVAMGETVEGHVAFVDVKPYRTGGSILGTTKWAVTVIDSSDTPHDRSDTRFVHKATGVGRGTYYVYADSGGTPVGYSTEMFSHYFNTNARPIAFGRPAYSK